MAADNGWTHIECAEALQQARHFGAASAHLVLAVEEAVKASVYYQWPALMASMTHEQLRELLYTHRVRHGIAVYGSMSQPLRASASHSGSRFRPGANRQSRSTRQLQMEPRSQGRAAATGAS